MFDLTKAAELLQAGLGTMAMAHQAPDPMDILASAGIDPGLLPGLTENEIVALLAEHGIDPSVLAGSQLDELLDGLGQQGIADHLTGIGGFIADKLRS